MSLPSLGTIPMKPISPIEKTVIVLGGFIAALVVAWALVLVGEPPELEDPSGGMRAFSDLLLGVAIYCALSAAPAGLGLYWLATGILGTHRPQANPVARP